MTCLKQILAIQLLLIVCSAIYQCRADPIKPSNCETNCSQEYKLVCGSDGITYLNECRLIAAECKTGLLKRVEYKGSCETDCANSPCRGGSYCLPKDDVVRCGCRDDNHFDCGFVAGEICGSDGLVYRSCEFADYICSNKKLVAKYDNETCKEYGYKIYFNRYSK